MILVKKITIEEFRGIRNITLNFNGKNFAVCGPNGTGKSGVVDALEFGLTGNISRLSGSGTGTISLKKHAPHVDSRDLPEKAKVILTVCIPALNNKEVTIERNVRDALTPIISPNTPEVLLALKQLEEHPEFVLSRRELIAYVLAQPGKRSEEIQALLRINQVGKLRSNLKTLCNSCDREKTDLKKALISSSNNLSRALEISELTPAKLLEAVNTRRKILGLNTIDILTNLTCLNDGLMAGTQISAPKINKKQAGADLKLAQELLFELSDAKTSAKYADIHKEVAAMDADSTILKDVSRENFLRTAIGLITESSCPVCDTEWSIEDLRSLVEKKIKKFEAIAKIRTALEKKLEPIIDLLERLNEAVLTVERHSKVIAPEYTATLFNYRVDLISRVKIMTDFLPLTKTISSLVDLNSIPAEVTAAISTIDKAIAAIPEATQQEAAMVYLTLCQDRLDIYRESARAAKRADEHASLVNTISNVYESESDKALECVYKQVEEDFGGFYRFINKDDEGFFTAHLTPSIGKLGFDVEFYGRGHFPPGAYHSEGHQDGMGLCLYLALMQRLQGGNFTFAVLDDVLMSVDVGHRREVCNLLKEYFPNTQFILTTHDEVWLKHMASAGLIGANHSVRFNNWTPDQGPTEWDNRNVWEEIDYAIKKNDVHTAASDLRYYLEHIYKEICHNLHAPVEYRGDGRYDLGDLVPSAVTKYRRIIADGKKVAQSWNRTEDIAELENREKNIADAFCATNADQWQINSAVHYNEWANLTSTEFALVATAFHKLVHNFFCDNPDCEGLYYLTFSTPKTKDALRCQCGKTNINLKKSQNIITQKQLTGNASNVKALD